MWCPRRHVRHARVCCRVATTGLAVLEGMCRRQEAGTAVEACLGPAKGDVLHATGSGLIDSHARWQVKVMSCYLSQLTAKGPLWSAASSQSPQAWAAATNALARHRLISAIFSTSFLWSSFAKSPNFFIQHWGPYPSVWIQ